MPHADDGFDLYAFLLGLAIAIGVMVFILLLVPRSPPVPPTQPVPTPTPVPQPVGRTLYLPEGQSRYSCSSNDGGGAVVMDGGGAVVMDDGKGNLVLDAPKIPAPGGAAYNETARGFQGVICGSNDGGGAVVMDGARQVVAVPIRRPLDASQTDALSCIRLGEEVAVIDGSDRRVRFSHRGDPIRLLSHGAVDDYDERIDWPSSSPAGAEDKWLFCALDAAGGLVLVDHEGNVVPRPEDDGNGR